MVNDRLYRKVEGSGSKFLYNSPFWDDKLYVFLRTPPERPERADRKSGVIHSISALQKKIRLQEDGDSSVTIFLIAI